ncbi:hypothetical protein PMAYCL1PPCAC_20662, partial [Pristionchus mayeri]
LRFHKEMCGSTISKDEIILWELVLLMEMLQVPLSGAISFVCKSARAFMDLSGIAANIIRTFPTISMDRMQSRISRERRDILSLFRQFTVLLPSLD